MNNRPGRIRSNLATLCAIAVALGSAGSVARAAIPDASGVFHGCLKNGPGTLRLIDTEAGQVCNQNESEVNWSRTGPAVPKVISGLINIDGTTALGSGFTSSRTAQGDYAIDFSAGTWNSFPVIVVSPFGLPGAFPIVEVASVVGSGGAATAHILVSSTAGPWTPLDAAFWFIAVGS